MTIPIETHASYAIEKKERERKKASERTIILVSDTWTAANAISSEVYDLGLKK